MKMSVTTCILILLVFLYMPLLLAKVFHQHFTKLLPMVYLKMKVLLTVL